MQSKFRRRGIGAAIEGPLVRQGLMALSQRQHGALWVVLSIAEAKMKELSVFAIQKARGGGCFSPGQSYCIDPMLQRLCSASERTEPICLLHHLNAD